MTQEPLMDEVKDVILEALVEKPILHSAAKAAGLSPLELRRAIDNDDQFARYVDEAVQIGKGAAENAIWERGVNGVKSPVVHSGKIVMVICEESGESVPLMEVKYSDKMLELYAKSQMRDVYGDKAKLEIEGTAVLVAPATANLGDFREMLAKHRKAENESKEDDS